MFYPKLLLKILKNWLCIQNIAIRCTLDKKSIENH